MLCDVSRLDCRFVDRDPPRGVPCDHECRVVFRPAPADPAAKLSGRPFPQMERE